MKFFCLSPTCKLDSMFVHLAVLIASSSDFLSKPTSTFRDFYVAQYVLLFRALSIAYIMDMSHIRDQLSLILSLANVGCYECAVYCYE